jgi:hypothetical protein
MPAVTHGYDNVKAMATYLRLAQTSLGSHVPPAFNHGAISRFITVDEDESVRVNSDDPLASALVDACNRMGKTEVNGQIEIEVRPIGTLAILFSRSQWAKLLKPKLFLCYDLRRENAPICGIATMCNFQRDEALSTDKLTPEFCRAKSIPNLSNWLLLDVIASKKRHTGVVLLLQVYLAMCRARDKLGLCAVAVTRDGASLFDSLGFDKVTYREKGLTKNFFYASAGSLSLEAINRRLTFLGDERLLGDLCYRFGLTSKTSNSIISRC